LSTFRAEAQVVSSTTLEAHAAGGRASASKTAVDRRAAAVRRSMLELEPAAA
jgi:hypothetical protein